MNVHVFDSGVSDGRCKCGQKADDPVHVLHMADSPSAPPPLVPGGDGEREYEISDDSIVFPRHEAAAARPREEEATALLREADEWPFPGQADFLIQRLASALRESRAREQRTGSALESVSADLLNVDDALTAAGCTHEDRVDFITHLAAEAEAQDLRVLCQRLSERAEAAERERETWQKLLQEWKAEAWARLAERDEAREELEATTSRIAQLEQSLALSEDKVKALRQQIEALPRCRVLNLTVNGTEKNATIGTMGYVDAVELAAVLAAFPPTPTTANPAASLTQQGDPDNG